MAGGNAMAYQSRQAAGAAAMSPDLRVDAPARLHWWRSIAVFAFAVALLLSLTVVTLLWDGLASYDRHTPGAPLSSLDAEQ